MIVKPVIFFLLLLCTACSSHNPLSGTYTYAGQDPDQKESEIVEQAREMMKEFADQDHLYSQIIFKGKKTVMVKSMNTEFAATYETDGDHVIIKATDGELIFKIKDDNTLIGEGFASGIYRKNYTPPATKKVSTKQNQKPATIKKSREIKVELTLPSSENDSL